MKLSTPLLLCFVFFEMSCFAQNKATHNVKKSEAVSSEMFQSMTFNGIWSWFSDPRAVYYEGKYKRTYAGWIDNYGDVHIGYYDHDTQKIASKVIYDNLEIDDHDNPSILVDDDGRLLVFFNTHLQDDRSLFLRTTINPEDINEWSPVKELYLNDKEKYSEATVSRHTYTNPVRLSKEAGKIYLFWRGIDLKPSYAVSTDNGITWSKGKILFQAAVQDHLKVPYTKVYSDGISKIHFTFTDGHPAKDKKNGLYYMYYENGAFYKANGKKIKAISELPVSPSEMDEIFQSDAIKSWNWDIAQDKKGNPVVTYVKFPDENTHIYSYATFTNGQWKSYDLLDAGGWFPKTRQGTKEASPHYAGGIVIDHETPNTLYLSVKRDTFFEIEQWTTYNNGKSWSVEMITKNSTKDNVRPVAVRNAKKGNSLQLLWLQNTTYIYYAHDTRGHTKALDFKDRYHTTVKMNLRKPKIDSTLNKENIIRVLRQAIAQLLENRNHEILSEDDWYYGVAYAGIEAFYDITKEERYGNELKNIQQYQQEGDEEESDADIFDLIWSYKTKNNRNHLQRIEEITSQDFVKTELHKAVASWIYAMRNYGEMITEIAKLKSEFSKTTETLYVALTSQQFESYHLRSKALIVYGLAAAINDGLIETEYSPLVLEAWKKIQLQWLTKKKPYPWAISTNGAVVLAGKEVLKLLNDER